MGLFGLSIPEEYGGLGLNILDDVAVNMIFGHTTPPFSTIFGTNIGIETQGIVIDGTEDKFFFYRWHLGKQLVLLH
jgi:acyl-CoA dehydrogenase